MIPICRDTGSVIAFGGRSMDADQVPKYLNSPETAIYSKGRTLYGLNLTKTAIRKLGYALLVEGYFDFAQLFQSDVFHAQGAPVIASCGTALTAQQAQLLRRFTTNVKLNFDPDTAGQSAATRSCELLVREGFEVKVVVLDKGEDPDTFLRKRGRGTVSRETAALACLPRLPQRQGSGGPGLPESRYATEVSRRDAGRRRLVARAGHA